MSLPEKIRSRRIQSEISNLLEDKNNGMYDITETENPDIINATIYQVSTDQKFLVQIELHSDYPLHPPTVTFLTPIKHLEIVDNKFMLFPDTWNAIIGLVNILGNLFLIVNGENRN